MTRSSGTFLLVACAILVVALACNRPPPARPSSHGMTPAGLDLTSKEANCFLASGASVLGGAGPMVAVGGFGPSAEAWWTALIDPVAGSTSRADAGTYAVDAVSNWFDGKEPKAYVVLGNPDAGCWALSTVDERGRATAGIPLDVSLPSGRPAEPSQAPEVDSAATNATGDSLALGIHFPRDKSGRVVLVDPRTGRQTGQPGPVLHASLFGTSLRYRWCLFWDSGGGLCYVKDGTLRRLTPGTGESKALVGPDVAGAHGSPLTKYAVAWTEGPQGKLFLIGPDGKSTALTSAGGPVFYAEADASGEHVIETVSGRETRQVCIVTRSGPGAAMDTGAKVRAYWVDAPKTAVLVGARTIEKLDLQTGKRTMLLYLDQWLSRNK